MYHSLFSVGPKDTPFRTFVEHAGLTADDGTWTCKSDSRGNCAHVALCRKRLTELVTGKMITDGSPTDTNERYDEDAEGIPPPGECSNTMCSSRNLWPLFKTLFPLPRKDPNPTWQSHNIPSSLPPGLLLIPTPSYTLVHGLFEPLLSVSVL